MIHFMVPVVENLPDDVISLRDIILSLSTSYADKEDHYKEHISILPVCVQRTGREEQIRKEEAKPILDGTSLVYLLEKTLNPYFLISNNTFLLLL